MPPNRVAKRASVACKACNSRKVRCTVTLSGPPCANCSVDGIPCVVQSRKRRRNSELLLSASPCDSKTSDDHGVAASDRALQPRPPVAVSSHNDAQVEDISPRAGNETVCTIPSGENARDLSPQEVHRPPTVTENGPTTCLSEPTPPHLPAIPFPRRRFSDFSDMAQESSAYAEALEGSDNHVNGVPFYPGDKRGPAFVIDICEPNKPLKNRHFFVPMPSIESMETEDVDYLRSKGVFSLPPQHLREALIHSYFHHIHPFAPILDATDFIPKYEKGRVSLLLLWSIFLAAASFVDDSMLSDDFYVSRLALKRAAYQRAKALYDADYEKDKITLIQSVFLMSHWYISTEDRTGPWHWSGIAISLSHTIGLHRQPMLTGQASRGIPVFWRRLWWSIYCREVWLSLGHGRPMRVSLDDSDVPLPGPEDTAFLSAEARFEGSQKYLPGDLDTLSKVWLSLVGVTRVLGTILSTNYTAKGTKPSKEELEQSENEIRECYCLPPESFSQSRVVASHIYQFKLFLQATIIVLYRPFIFDTPRDLPTIHQGTWRIFASQKTRTAASEAIGAVNSMMAEDLIGLCHTITVLALVPPMQIHLLESTSLKPMTCQMGKHNLALCMLAMGELRKSYVSAEAAFKLFERAKNKIERTMVREEPPRTPAEVRPAEAVPDDGNWVSYTEGYAISTPGIISDLWAPFSTLIPDDDPEIIHTDSWLDIQNMHHGWTIDRFGLS